MAMNTENCGTLTDNTYYGLYLEGCSQTVTIGGNINYSSINPNAQKYGVYLSGDNNTVIGTTGNGKGVIASPAGKDLWIGLNREDPQNQTGAVGDFNVGYQNSGNATRLFQVSPTYGVYSYGNFTVNGSWIQNAALTTDPSTTGWGAAEKGRMWFNTTGNVLKYWDGSIIKTVTAQ